MRYFDWYLRSAMQFSRVVCMMVSGLILLLSCRSRPSKQPLPGALPEPDASTIFIYSNENGKKMQMQVQSFHPEYCEMQLAFSTYPGQSWKVEVMADALDRATSLLTVMEPANMRLNKQTAWVLSRKVSSSLRDSGKVWLEWSEALKAYEANGDSMVLYQPEFTGMFQVFQQQPYRIALNGNGIVIPTSLCQSERKVLRYAECGDNQIAIGWYNGKETWELESVWHYRDMPVCGELRAGNWLLYTYHHPVEGSDKHWTYKTDTLLMTIKRSDTLLIATLSAFSREKKNSKVLGNIEYNRRTGLLQHSLDRKMPLADWGFVPVHYLDPLFKDGFVKMALPGMPSQPLALEQNQGGNNLWDFNLRLNGLPQSIECFRAGQEDGNMGIAFIADRRAPILLHYKSGMYDLRLVEARVGKTSGKPGK